MIQMVRLLMIMVASLPELHNYSDDKDRDEDCKKSGDEAVDEDGDENGNEDSDEDGFDDNLVVVPLPKNFMSPPSIISQKHRGM